MARVTMARAAVSMRPSAHSPLDNVSTKYNPIRLLKGAPPGQVIIQNKIFCIKSAKHSLLGSIPGYVFSTSRNTTESLTDAG